MGIGCPSWTSGIPAKRLAPLALHAQEGVFRLGESYALVCMRIGSAMPRTFTTRDGVTTHYENSCHDLYYCAVTFSRVPSLGFATVFATDVCPCVRI